MAGLTLLCSGQGKQDAAMFERLRPYPEAQTVLECVRAAGLLPPEFDRPETWFRNEVAQPLLCLYQLMALAVVKPLLPPPELIAGYSLGELVAYAVAGAFSPTEAVRLATRRGELMSAAATATGPQTMVAVIGLKRNEIEARCAAANGAVAIVNDSDHFIVGLPEPAAADFLAAVTQAGASKAVRLEVTVASHTPFMDRAAADFAEVLSATPLAPFAPPVTAGVSGEKVYTPGAAVAALTAQMHRTVDWRACLDTALSDGGRVFLELGPGHALARMVREIAPTAEARSLEEFHDLRAVGRWYEAVAARQYGTAQP